MIMSRRRAVTIGHGISGCGMHTKGMPRRRPRGLGSQRVRVPAGGRGGFTLIELMVALVVGGMLMATLVGMSAAIQKSAGWSRELSDIQANLRLAMKAISDDLLQAAFMAPADMTLEQCKYPGQFGGGPTPPPAIAWDNGTRKLSLSGNLASSREFLIDLQGNPATQATVMCRNGMPFEPVLNCGGDRDAMPFGFYSAIPAEQAAFNAQQFNRVFCNGQLFRINRGSGVYGFFNVQAPVPATFSFQLNPSINRDHEAFGVATKGDRGKWVNPITSLEYQAVPAGIPPGTRGVALRRTQTVCGTPEVRDLVEFLLPVNGTQWDGFQVQVYPEPNPPATYCGPRPASSIDPNDPTQPPQAATAANMNPVRARAILVTLRARTVTEDPKFFIQGYGANDAQNFGFDLDGDPSNGLARVRTESTLIQLKNLVVDRSMM